MLFIGLDVHQRSFALCILDQHGKRIKQIQQRGGWRELLEVLRGLRRPFKVCFEASLGYGHLHDQLKRLARQVVVVHPGHVRLIFQTKRKHDRIDARKLAVLLFLDQAPAVHVPDIEVRGWRRMIEFRQRLVARGVRAKNGLRGLLRAHGLSGVAGKGLWTQKGRAWLARVKFAERTAAVQRDILLEELRYLELQRKRVEGELQAIAAKHPGVQLLRTIPGVGPRTAEAVVAYIDDPRRFGTSRQVGCYFGLVPCQDQSADRNRLGHITREGPATVRKLLTEAAWQGIRRDARLKQFFERVRRADPERRKIALVATTHYLIRAMFAMLRSGEVWRKLEEPAAQSAA
jgi:transposase